MRASTRSGAQPQNETKHGEKRHIDELYADPTKLEQFSTR